MGDKDDDADDDGDDGGDDDDDDDDGGDDGGDGDDDGDDDGDGDDDAGDDVDGDVDAYDSRNAMYVCQLGSRWISWIKPLLKTLAVIFASMQNHSLAHAARIVSGGEFANTES